MKSLPGTALLGTRSFGERPEALCLRLATSMLYDMPEARSADEREAVLWKLLAQADEVVPQAPTDGHILPLSELGRAQERLTAFVQGLNRPEENRA